jgi:hypothetical protein
MQVTHISAYSLKMVAKKNALGINVVGYTVKPGYSNGLQMTDRKPVGKYVGFATC